jgi:hypothetical protein
MRDAPDKKIRSMPPQFVADKEPTNFTTGAD